MKMYTNSNQTAKLIELGFEKPRSIASVEPIYGMGGISVAKAYTIGELLSFLPENIAKERYRLVYATNRITELGYTVKWVEQSKCLQFEHKWAMVRFFPYTGWFSGKTVKDGRGLANLLKQLQDDTEN